MMSSNLNNTDYYAAELLVYFEKHKLLDIITKLITEICFERPANTRKWICENIHRLAGDVCKTRTFLQLPSNDFDMKEFVQTMMEKCNIPTLVYTKKNNAQSESTDEILKKIQKYFQKHGLHCKHKIFINFPKNCMDVMHFQSQDITPTSVIQVEGTELEPSFKQIQNFYSHLVEIIKTPTECGQSRYLNLIADLLNLMKNTISPIEAMKLCTGFYNRVVIYGRRGSGRKSQAITLAKRFNLVYINVEQLVLETLKANNPMSHIMRAAFNNESPHQPELLSIALTALIWERLLQSDSLRSGWVMTNGFPNNANEFKRMMEVFTVPPNKVIFLHCRQRKAMRRLVRQWENRPTGRPNDNCSYAEQEMEYFNSQESEILEYLARRRETIHIDGSQSFANVRTFLWASLEHQHNVIGSKDS